MVILNLARSRRIRTVKIRRRAARHRELVPHGIRAREGIAAVRSHRARCVRDGQVVVLYDLILPNGVAAIDGIARCCRAVIGRICIHIAVESSVDIVARCQTTCLWVHRNLVFVVAVPACA